ncbi:bifunctional phosphoribosylaminoimidazolecarboxamide formyltransferase/IMP cyclohydrolase, partial [bacterium]|nr:bifunctional phosphoribosylaminoimidazolecarboxamide formyltransferase/IMP cyclohydrolase [bacterium]
MKIQRALLSVADKTGLVELARALAAAGVEVLSTGGTAQALRDAGLRVTDVSAETGHPEILGGRLKTLHPKIHGGILARRSLPRDLSDLEAHGIRPIDLVVVNLYEFEAAASREGISLEALIEEIDIGGVALGARFLDAFLRGKGEIQRELRAELAVLAFERTAAYDRAIAAALSSRGLVPPSRPSTEELPERLEIESERVALLRYGENPHQRGAFYRDPLGAPGVASARVLSEGKALSYNNILDLDAALGVARDLEGPGVAVVKHAGPCGAAEDQDLARALEAAWEGDPLSAFGSVL